MKNVIFIFLMSSCLLDGRQANPDVYYNKHYEEAINNFNSDKNSENIEALASRLAGSANYTSDYKNDYYYKKLQSTLLSMEGHAQYFANEIEKYREKMNHDPHTSESGYDRFRGYRFINVFVHLPSPETIWVLGNYLSDERDVRPKRGIPTPENAYLALYSLSRIGLRDSPYRPILAPVKISYVEGWEDALPTFRAWWEEVKSGQRAFSFIGQNVEYRFNPDGTWETTIMENPPNDGEAPESAISTTIPPLINGEEKEKSPDAEILRKKSLWPWIVGGILFLTAFAFWIKRRLVA